MGRLIISLKDELHQSLKETAGRQSRSIGKIIEEGLELRGVKLMSYARLSCESTWGGKNDGAAGNRARCEGGQGLARSIASMTHVTPLYC